jgi:hypothetical protein
VVFLLGLTVALATLTLLGYARTSGATHLTGAELFTELAGAGTLLAGIGAMLAVWFSYLDRKRKSERQVNDRILDSVISAMKRPIQADDVRALAVLARELNGNEEAVKEAAGLLTNSSSGDRVRTRHLLKRLTPGVRRPAVELGQVQRKDKGAY